MEKQVEQFAKAGEAFQLEPSQGGAPIVMEIEKAIPIKHLLRPPLSGAGLPLNLTGNPIIDFFKRANAWLAGHSRVKLKEKAAFFRMLSVMVNAGLTIIGSLDTLAMQAGARARMRQTVYDLARQVEQGTRLSEAMEKNSGVFDDAEIGMIRAGEASGQLSTVLKNIAENLEKSASIRGKIIGALTYPAVVLSLLVVVIFIMMVSVIPKITELFTQSKQELPFYTRALISISDFTRSYSVVIIAAIAALVIALVLFRRTEAGRYQWDLFVLRIPLVGPLIKKGILTKFARSLANMIGAGVPIIMSLRIIAGALGNEVYRQRILLATQDLEQGIPLAENLSESSLFPGVLVNMIQVGEKTAQLDNVAAKVADFFDEEVDTSVKALTKAFEPIMLILIGGTVGGVVAAIMLPLIQLTGSAGTT